MAAYDALLAPNSAASTSVASSILVGPDQTPPASGTGSTGPTGAITLTSPMPSITPPRPGDVTPASPGTFCTINAWISSNPWLSLGGVAALYFLLRGGKKK